MDRYYPMARHKPDQPALGRPKRKPNYSGGQWWVAKGPVGDMHAASQSHNFFPKFDWFIRMLLHKYVESKFDGLVKSKPQRLLLDMASFFSAQHQRKAWFYWICLIIQDRSHANHYDVLIFGIVGCIAPNPQWVVVRIRGYRSQVRLHILQM